MPFARRQMVERRLERARVRRRADDEDALAQHAASLVERHERQLRESIDLSKRLAERLERGVAAGGNGQRVGEGGERARRHRLGSWAHADDCARDAGRIAGEM